ncbi:hypothetical protein HMF8227_02158 [Saliniradius amylolyticus]|uniref:Solute-binding protein family 3/N-terminal domain-containing protein n=1 Tax=Saliniradius amylolyticus TaxID=2183582 RepID=A0A2S2E4N4_9ALTE|nr:transporter substrate-binding domain-containing protein [Saliniradius amylolyticus]AWL12616.1 hypothetical protein HMF8227_02158 [Saliniradius amylolyticus]
MRLMLISLSLLLLACHTVQARTITIASGITAPYTSPKLPEQGYVNHVVREAFASQGYTVSFVYLPWARAYEEALSGRFDATSYWYNSQWREKDFHYSQPVISERLVFFRRQSDGPQLWQNLDDFKDLRIGLTRGYTYTKELWALAERSPERFSVVNTDRQNLTMLALGRIDLFPVDEITGWHLAESYLAPEQARRLETLPRPLNVVEGHVLFPKAKAVSRSLLNSFNKGLNELIENGRMSELEEQLVTGFYSQPIEAGRQTQ